MSLLTAVAAPRKRKGRGSDFIWGTISVIPPRKPLFHWVGDQAEGRFGKVKERQIPTPVTTGEGLIIARLIQVGLVRSGQLRCCKSARK